MFTTNDKRIVKEIIEWLAIWDAHRIWQRQVKFLKECMEDSEITDREIDLLDIKL